MFRLILWRRFFITYGLIAIILVLLEVVYQLFVYKSFHMLDVIFGGVGSVLIVFGMEFVDWKVNNYTPKWIKKVEKS